MVDKLQSFVSDIGMLTLNRYILLDPILLFFISGATYATTKFRHFQRRRPDLDFTPVWWSLLALVGVMLAGAISVKFVGLFVVLLVGMDTAWQLWDVLGDLSRPFSHTVRHFAARALCLIVLPVVIYVAIFWVHLTVLYKRLGWTTMYE